MIDPNTAFNVAMNVGPGSWQHQAAEAVAMVRDGAPYSLKQTPFGMIEHWRAIIFESLLMDGLRP